MQVFFNYSVAYVTFVLVIWLYDNYANTISLV